MSADTAMMSDRTKLQLILRLESLGDIARKLIAGEKRSAEEADLLLRALQAFKDRRLAGVFVGSDQLGNKEILDALSLQISDTALSTSAKRYLKKRGVRYLGELYYVFFDPRGKGTKEMREEIFRFLTDSLGLAASMDPLQFGWEPPYWQDQGFLALVAMSPLAYFGDLAGEKVNRWIAYETRKKHPVYKTWARYTHNRGIHSMAHYLQSDRGPSGKSAGSPSNAWGVGQLLARQKQLAMRTGNVLWAGALIPLTLLESFGAPSDWLAEKAVMDKEVAEWEAEKAKKKARNEAAELLLRKQLEEARKLTEGRSLDELEWSIRTRRGLKKAGFTLLEQLTLVSDRALFGAGRLGWTSIDEIKLKLKENGLSLAQDKS